MKILYLHGLNSGRGGRKASALRQRFGIESVIDDDLPYSSRLMHSADLLASEGVLRRSRQFAQALFERCRPDIIVASSLGGAIALALDAGATPMVLIAPLWNAELRPAGMMDWVSSRAAGSAAGALAATALRRLADELSAAGVPATVRPATILLHSRHDRIVGCEQSERLLANSPIPSTDPAARPMRHLIESLTQAGYCDRTWTATPGDGRLILIGRDHNCNEPDPQDTLNRDPHPHHALVKSVELLLASQPTHRPDS